MKHNALTVALLFFPYGAGAYCPEPLPPPLTGAEIASEFRDVFADEFAAYFSDVETYLRCIDEERSRVFLEAKETVLRYDRFMKAFPSLDE